MAFHRLVQLNPGDSPMNRGNKNPVCVRGVSIAGLTNRMFTCISSLNGRYVIINLVGKQHILTLCEVQVFAYTSGNYETGLHKCVLCPWKAKSFKSSVAHRAGILLQFPASCIVMRLIFFDSNQKRFKKEYQLFLLDISSYKLFVFDNQYHNYVKLPIPSLNNSLSNTSLSSLDSIPVILINIITVLLCLLLIINLFLLPIRITYR